jgi:predicted HicB family RNase H-like nuclease
VQTVARIHYEIPDDLHRQVKSQAALEGKTLKQFVIDALAEAVRKNERKGR